MGESPDYPQIVNRSVATGSMFSDQDVRSLAKSAIVGKTVVDQLFPGENPIGQTLRIRNVPFQIVGVLTAKGFNLFGQDQDDIVIVPYTSHMHRITTRTHAHVKSETPVYIGLGEIVCESSVVADSVYSLLKAGESFDALASNFSISKSKGNHGDLGQVDISRYGERLRRVLKGLDENAYTEPLALGSHFVIFKRHASDVRFE